MMPRAENSAWKKSAPWWSKRQAVGKEANSVTTRFDANARSRGFGLGIFFVRPLSVVLCPAFLFFRFSDGLSPSASRKFAPAMGCEFFVSFQQCGGFAGKRFPRLPTRCL